MEIRWFYFSIWNRCTSAQLARRGPNQAFCIHSSWKRSEMVSNSFCHKTKPTVEDLKQEFLNLSFMFLVKAEMLGTEDPFSYVFHLLSYMQMTNPTARKLKKWTGPLMAWHVLWNHILFAIRQNCPWLYRKIRRGGGETSLHLKFSGTSLFNAKFAISPGKLIWLSR